MKIFQRWIEERNIDASRNPRIGREGIELPKVPQNYVAIGSLSF